MGQLDKMANALFGGKRAETQDGFAQDKTATIIGTAVTDSDSGAVMVELSSDVSNPEPVEIDGTVYFEDASTAVELPTTQAVQAGDEVLVSVYGGTALKNSVVTGVVGSGDRIAADAEAARAIAEATGQHFWDDTNGAHVTEATREEWEQDQTGPNSLWNSLGMLFRDGLNNLLAIVTGATPGLQIFDGQGNAAENILAEFTSTLVRIGGKLAETGRSTAAVQFFEDASAETAIEAEHYIASGEAVTHGLTIRSRTDDSATDLPAGRWAQGAIGTFEQVYSDSSGFSVQASTGIHARDNGTGSDFLTADVQAEIQRIGSNKFSRVHMNADSVRLQIASTGVIRDYGMQHVIDALTTGTDTVTLSGATTTRTHEVVRRGFTAQMTILTFKLSAELANGSSVQIGTIPSGYRPASNMFFQPYVGNATYAGRVFMAVETGGGVRVYNFTGAALPTSVIMTATAAYLVA